MEEEFGRRQAEAALEVLREIEKAKLRIQAEVTAIPAFGDYAANTVWMLSDLAADALRRVEAAKLEEREGPEGPEERG